MSTGESPRGSNALADKHLAAEMGPNPRAPSPDSGATDQREELAYAMYCAYTGHEPGSVTSRLAFISADFHDGESNRARWLAIVDRFAAALRSKPSSAPKLLAAPARCPACAARECDHPSPGAPEGL